MAQEQDCIAGHIHTNGAGHFGAAISASSFGCSPFGRPDIRARGRLGAAIWAPDVSSSNMTPPSIGLENYA